MLVEDVGDLLLHGLLLSFVLSERVSDDFALG